MQAVTCDPWRQQAACRGVDPNVFYRQADEDDRRWQQRAAVAKIICRGCPVRQECFNDAVVNREDDGIWAGIEFPTEWQRSYGLRHAAAAPFVPPVRAAASDRS